MDSSNSNGRSCHLPEKLEEGVGPESLGDSSRTADKLRELPIVSERSSNPKIGGVGVFGDVCRYLEGAHGGNLSRNELGILRSNFPRSRVCKGGPDGVSEGGPENPDTRRNGGSGVPPSWSF